MGGPLEGIRVVELGGKGPTPFAGMMLADMGADVIVCERPALENTVDTSDVLTRGKTRLLIDLRSSPERSQFFRLLENVDVVVEGFRPGVVERLGVGPTEVLAANPTIVYGRMTGYGQHNDYSLVAGHDINFISMSSALHHIGPADAPPVVPLNLAGDFGGGGMFLVAGVLAALVERARTGSGQVIDAAMTDGSALLMASIFGSRADGTWSDSRENNIVDGGAPFYGVYGTADGRYISVGALVPAHYAEVLRVCGLSDDLPDPADRTSWPEMRRRLAAIFALRDRAHWVAAFDGVEASFSAVLAMDEVAEHPYHRERGTFPVINGVLQPAPAPRFGRTPSSPGGIPDRQKTTAEVLEIFGSR